MCSSVSETRGAATPTMKDLPKDFLIGVMALLSPEDVGSLCLALPRFASHSSLHHPSLWQSQATECVMGSESWSFLLGPVLRKIAEITNVPPQLLVLYTQPRQSERFPVIINVDRLRKLFEKDEFFLSQVMAREVNSRIGNDGAIESVRADRGQIRVSIRTSWIVRMSVADALMEGPMFSAEALDHFGSMCSFRMEALTSLTDDILSRTCLRHLVNNVFEASEEAIRGLILVATILAKRSGKYTTRSMEKIGFALRLKDIERSFFEVLLPYFQLQKDLRVNNGAKRLSSLSELEELKFTRRQAAILLHCLRLRCVSARWRHCEDFQHFTLIMDDLLKAAQAISLSDTYNDVSTMLKSACSKKAKEQIQRTQLSNMYIIQQACDTIEKVILLILGKDGAHFQRLHDLIGH